jgi:hypothetical protein
MKVSLTLFSALLLAFVFATNISFAQNQKQKQLDFIKDYPIKIDGGCSFYTFDTTTLTSDKYLFVISAKNVGFISFNNEYLYFKIKKPVATNQNKITNSFEGTNYTIKLEVSASGMFDENNYLYVGQLTMKDKKGKLVWQYNVHGKVAKLL